MIFENGKTSKGKTLKARNFRKSYVILTPFEEICPEIFLSYAVGECFTLSMFLGSKPIAIALAIGRNKAKEKARFLARWVTH